VRGAASLFFDSTWDNTVHFEPWQYIGNALASYVLMFMSIAVSQNYEEYSGLPFFCETNASIATFGAFE
jgi:hypothetical protein